MIGRYYRLYRLIWLSQELILAIPHGAICCEILLQKGVFHLRRRELPLSHLDQFASVCSERDEPPIGEAKSCSGGAHFSSFPLSNSSAASFARSFLPSCNAFSFYQAGRSRKNPPFSG